MRFFSTLLLYTLSLVVYGQEIFPQHCSPIALTNDHMTLSAPEKRIIMIHNLSKNDVWITAFSDTSTLQSTAIKTNNWAALALYDHAIKLNCIETRPGHEQQIACKDTVAVCGWALKAQPDKPTETHWAGESQALSSLTAYIERHGFIVPSSHQSMVD